MNRQIYPEDGKFPELPTAEEQKPLCLAQRGFGSACPKGLLLHVNRQICPEDGGFPELPPAEDKIPFALHREVLAA